MLTEEVKKYTMSVDNSQARCFLLESELQRAEKIADGRMAEIEKLQEAAKEGATLLEKVKLKQEEDIKVFIDKINLQGKQLKELAVQ